MCDTLVALRNSTENGNVIFAKNSDRPQNEIQLITYAPKFHYNEGDTVNCTYISIPQINETAAILLSQPYWMWGAEMGANEYGVVIGNEAVYTHEPLRSEGLLGMDLLRLGLERGNSAYNTTKIITEILEKYHQGGGCSYEDSTWTYHNSFIIADSKEAYILETADDWWIVEKVIDVRSISNGISIRGKGDFRREGIINHAIEMGYCKDEDDFDFAITFSGSYASNINSPLSRGGKSTSLLKKNIGKITPSLMMEFLREHDVGICMHGGFESTGSQVSELRKEGNDSIHWLTGSTLPCLSIYKPYTFPLENQKVLKSGPYKKRNSDWYWTRHSHFIRTHSNLDLKNQYLSKIELIEKDVIDQVKKVILNDQNIKSAIEKINSHAWEMAEELIYF
ncbi:MAG: C69 family dipeptidase [Candidatus Lokiarchaeota archaeon]|nr:C69 family dipeptidase [Candidatus Lokiarchaeota archaeon]